jgi:hypothetical protein
MKQQVKKIKEEQGQFSKKDLAINWFDIMKFFNLKPGPKVWKLIDQAFERVIEDPKNRNQKEKILNYLKNLK